MGQERIRNDEIKKKLNPENVTIYCRICKSPRVLSKPGERASGTHWIGSWVDPRAGLDDLEKRTFFTLPGLELWPLGRPARN
jgi:hypothetical protein